MNKQDGQYSHDRPWQSVAERLSNTRTWNQAGPTWSPPVIPDAKDQVPPRFGYQSSELTAEQIFEGFGSRLQASMASSSKPDDFSGRNGSYSSGPQTTGSGGSGL
jgi:hypothetical protein